MLTRSLLYLLLLAALAAPGVAGPDEPVATGMGDGMTPKSPADLGYAAGAAPAERILSTVGDATLRSLISDVLARNPEIAAAAARAEAAEQRAPQVRALPDPMAGITAFLSSPETRVGPQEVSARISQKFPWFGKLKLREQAELYTAAASRAGVEATRLKLLTETRRLYYELGFVDELAEIVLADRAILSHYEELAAARYRSGVGLQQAVVKLQAEITKATSRLLEIADRRATVVAALNALRDFPQATPIPGARLPDLPAATFDLASLRERALLSRPEMIGAEARIARSTAVVGLADKNYKPDVTVGLFYTLVGSRDDPAGRLNPPPDNGDDVLGLSAGINLPIWREKLAAGVEEALKRELAARESKRSVITGIDRSFGELPARIDLTWSQLRLFEDVLVVQAEQSLLSAEAGYSAGSQDALDLLDAERVLLDVRTGTERNRADYAIAIAQLEGAVGEPLTVTSSSREAENR